METIISQLFGSAPKTFTDKVRIDGDCVVWTAATVPKGYGAFKYQRKTHRAHRLAYLWHYGALDEDAVLMHTCDNPACVKPTHLKAGTRATNNRDMADKGRACHGSRHTHSKLNEQKVAEARERYKNGETLDPMAKEYGVSLPTLWYAVVGKTWKHVPVTSNGA